MKTTRFLHVPWYISSCEVGRPLEPTGPHECKQFARLCSKKVSKVGECAALVHTVHEEPVSRQHPDEHQHDGEREGQQLSQGEAAAAAEGNPAAGWRERNREKTV